MKYFCMIPFFLLFFWSALACASEESEFFSKVRAVAREGNIRAQYHLGMLYNNGIGTQKDTKEAMTWFLKSAQAGDPLAAYKVGCYYDGQINEAVKRDKDKALSYKLIAATAGYSLAQHDVANLSYEKGQYDEALKWWKKAADQGVPLSLYNLSSSYHNGHNVPQDYKMAYIYFKLAKMMAGGGITATAQETLNSTKSKMTSKEIEEAESYIAMWKPFQTELTQRALRGARDAEDLVGNK